MALINSRRKIALLAGAVALGGIALAARWTGGGEAKDGDAAAALHAGPGGDADAAGIVVVELATSSSKLDVGLRRAGIRPESLAAAGVSAVQLGILLQRADQWFIANPTLLSEADAAYGAARVERDALQRKVRSGLATSQEVLDLQQAKGAFEAAEGERTAVLDALFQAATANLSGTQIATLSRIRANARWKFPVHFLVEDREQATWIQLRDGLANERIAPLFEDDPDSGCQSFLAEMRSRQAVVQARANVDTYLASVQGSWDASLD